jgi:trimeric autotransporter adhesin
VATGTGLTYQWRLGVTNLTDGGTISGATTATLNISSLVAGDAGNYTCDISDLCASSLTTTVSALTVNTGAAITTQPVATQTLCAGSAASISVVATGTALTYQWNLGATPLVDGGTISGATTATLNISSLVAGDAGSYTCEVTASGCGAPTTSNTSVLTINVPVNITTQPVATQTLCTGNAASFSVVATGTSLTYQWRLGATALVDGGTISGATTATLNISSLVVGDAGNYTCDITDQCASSVTTTVSALVVNTGAAITTQPAAAQTFCVGSAASFSLVASGAGLTYQWNLGATPLVDGGTISGATTATLNISSVVAGDAGNYTCDVTASGCGAATTSAIAVLNVNVPASITTQPIATQTLCSSSAATVSVIATGTGLTYQWRLGATNLVNGGTISGATTATLNISSLVAGDAGNYTCVITDLCAAPQTTSVSVLNVSSGSAVITTQPANIVACLGQPALLDLIATGAGLTYQWRKNGVDMVNGGNVSGATTPSLVLNAATAGDAATYTCVVSSTCGAPVTSSPAVLTVGSSTIVITRQPVSAVICLSQQASFSVLATGATSYQWQFRPTAGVYADITNGGGVSGATTATIVINNAQFANRGNYRCVLGGGGCSGGTPSAAASLSFESPMIISEPLSQSLCNSQTATFSLVALGNNLSYQWIKNGAVMINGGNVSGANSATLNISNVDVVDNATYYCIVQGLCPPPALSDNVTLFVSFCTDVAEANQENVFRVYPNPSQGLFNVELRKFTGNSLSYEVYNTLGERVSDGQYDGGGDVSSTLDLSDQASGVYLLKLRYGDTQVWERLVLEK